MSRLLSALPLTAVVALSGCQARQPGHAEITVMTYAKHHILVPNKRLHNPLPDTTATLADGKEAFGHYCVACHGMDGQDTGVPFAENISPPIPSLASPSVQEYSDSQLKWIIDKGIWPSGMPASSGVLSDDEQWSIIVFLRHLPPAGSQGVPDLYTH